MPRYNVLGRQGERLVMMGNEAIARGALEAGVGVATGYPGTPSSEVLEALIEASRHTGIYAEWSVNEKVALETALGAAWGGLRSLTTMKAPGILVASDPLVSAAYSGVNAGMVVLVADDPGPHTTQTEQDSRWFAQLSHLPVATASTLQDAKDHVPLLYELSEETGLPVIYRTTTRINHSLGMVELGPLRTVEKRGEFRREPERFVRASMEWNRARHRWLLEALGKALKPRFVERLVDSEGDGAVGVVVSGAPYLYVKELAEAHGLKVSVLRLDMLNPFPEEKILDFASRVDKILVVEESDPYIEERVKLALWKEDLRVEVHGKDLLPLVGEIWPHHLAKALAKLGVDAPSLAEPLSPGGLPRRPPPLCPGCPHRSSFHIIRRALGLEGLSPGRVPVIGDIGCYALALNPPLSAIWTEHAMGSSIAQALGLKLAGHEGPVVAVIGDSTMFHTGLPALIDAYNKDADILVAVLDNEVVAMTGHQPTPAHAVSPSGRRMRPVSLERILEAVAPGRVEVVDAFDVEGGVEAVRRALRAGGLRVVVFKAPCAIVARRVGLAGAPLVVVEEKCTGCMACIRSLGCLALISGGGKVRIDPEQCTGCGLCVHVCPYNAIVGGDGA